MEFSVFGQPVPTGLLLGVGPTRYQSFNESAANLMMVRPL
jgi:hypothetical protein